MTVIDARGMRCPWPAIRFGRAVRQGAESPIDILADDPNAGRELEAVAISTGFTIAKIGIHAFRALRDSGFQ